MQIGAIGGAGLIGAISYNPYIYNTNQVSAKSMGKVSAISDDVTAGKTDFSGLTGENVNPLKKNQTANFADVLAMQFQLGQQNATRLLKPEERVSEEDATQGVANLANQVQAETPNAYQRNQALAAYTMNMIA